VVDISKIRGNELRANCIWLELESEFKDRWLNESELKYQEGIIKKVHGVKTKNGDGEKR
jgi:hypothetical protein